MTRTAEPRGTVALVGPGQLGRLVGGGLLACGQTVVPFGRGDSLADLGALAPRVVLVAVGEDDLGPVLAALPEATRGRVALLQNELSPEAWEAHGVVDPTVLVVWSEKKAGRALHAIRPTLVAGPEAALVRAALAAVDVPEAPLARGELARALVVKNLYILVSNLAGLRVGGTVEGLLGPHRALAHALAHEILAVERARLGARGDAPDLEPASLLAELEAAFAADPAHATTGRSAPGRLARLVARARRLGVPLDAVLRLPGAPRD